MCLVKKLYKLDDYCGIVICGEYPPKSPMAIWGINCSNCVNFWCLWFPDAFYIEYVDTVVS